MTAFVVIVLGSFLSALLVLCAIIPTDLRWSRVGGLIHWRVGRVGGSFYRARKAR